VAIVLLVVLGAATPLVAHAIGGRCWIYLPAHVPALLAGLALGPIVGFATGAATAVSDLLWGGRVHGLAFLPLGLEFVSYGLVAGVASVRGDRYPKRMLALIVAMLAGRMVYLAAAALLGRDLVRTAEGLFLAPWPGMLFQLVALPLVAPLVQRFGRAGRA
jgi:hypothetical protein